MCNFFQNSQFSLNIIDKNDLDLVIVVVSILKAAKCHLKFAANIFFFCWSYYKPNK